MSKPGVMFYFEFRPSLSRLTLEEKGRLLDAMLDYSQFGIQPELEGVAGVVWDFLQQKVDRDSARYTRALQQKQYAAYVRKLNAQGLPKPDFETWLAQQKEQEITGSAQPSTDDSTRLQPETDDIHTTNSKQQTTNPKLQTSNSKPQTSNSILHTSNAKGRISSLQSAAVSDGFRPPGLEEVERYCKKMGFSVDPESFFDYYSANGWRIGSNPMQNWQAALRQWHKKQKEKGNEQSETDFPWVIGTHV